MDKARICVYCGSSNLISGQRCKKCGYKLDSSEVDVEILQKALEFGALRKTFRSGGGWLIFWGIIAILSGFIQLPQSSLNFLLIPIGLFLVITGIAGRDNLSTGVIVGDGLALLLVGVWNIGITILDALNGYLPTFWGILGFLQIVWGIKRIMLIPRYYKVADVPLPIVDHAERLVDYVQEKQPNSEKIIELQFEASRWKTLFTTEMVILVTDKGKEVLFVPRSQFALSLQEGPQPRKPAKVSIHLGEEIWDGSISVEHLERYQKLSSALEKEAPVAGTGEVASIFEPATLPSIVVESSSNDTGDTPGVKTPEAVFSTRCSRCNQARIPGDKYCRTCGYKYEDARFCPKCSQELISGDLFCRMCGVKIETGNISQQPVPVIKV